MNFSHNHHLFCTPNIMYCRRCMELVFCFCYAWELSKWPDSCAKTIATCSNCFSKPLMMPKKKAYLTHMRALIPPSYKKFLRSWIRTFLLLNPQKGWRHSSHLSNMYEFILELRQKCQCWHVMAGILSPPKRRRANRETLSYSPLVHTTCVESKKISKPVLSLVSQSAYRPKYLPNEPTVHFKHPKSPSSRMAKWFYF